MQPPSQPEQVSLPDYGNEKIFQRNRLPARAYHIPRDAILLSGIWDFHYASTPINAPKARPSSSHTPESPISIISEGIGNLDGDVNDDPIEWSPISVPGHWQLQGYGRPQYTNVVFPFPVCPPHVPTENPTGTYRRIFSIPTSWEASSNIRLRFEGVDSAFHLFVNGIEIGYSQGSRNPSEFDVTSFISRDRTNELMVRVYQWCDGSYIEDQDQWWLSGIFRDVHLLCLPASRIENFHIKTPLDNAYKDASLEIDLDVVLIADVDVSIFLRDPSANNHIVQHGAFSLNQTCTQTSFSLTVANPRKWTAETPFLYNVELELCARGSRDPIHTIQARVGFRLVEIKEGLLMVNGTPLLLQGVNRHDHHPKRGRAVPLSFIREDLLLMKQHNINALRCAHYPPDPRMLDLCDELGLWVMDEADLECHGFYDAVARPLDIPEEMDYEERKKLAFPQAAAYTSDNPAWKDQYLDRMNAVTQRDKNHPSVIIWSLGNEAFYGQNHKAMYDYVKRADPTRPVHYEGDANAVSADMFSYMYPSVERLINLAKTEGVRDGVFEKPIVLCEYAHAMGNGPGNLAGYQDAFRMYPRLQGGFIWEWANHGLLKEESNKTFYAYGGDFDDFPNDGTFVMDGLCFSDHSPTPGLCEYKKIIEPVTGRLERGEIVIENRYQYIGLEHLVAVWKVEGLGARSNLLNSGILCLPKVAAGGSASVLLPTEVQNIDRDGDDEIWLTISFRLASASKWADAGHEVAWFQDQLNIHAPCKGGGFPQSILPTTPLHVRTSLSAWAIGNDYFEIKFDRARGVIKSWLSDGKTVLLPDPASGAAIMPSFWRAPTDNDRSRDDPYWKRFGLNAMMSQLRNVDIHRLSATEVEVKVRTFLSPPILDWGFDILTTYNITADETLSVCCRITPMGKMPEMVPRIGLDLRLTKSLTQSRYHGLGPGESYPDKLAAQTVGIYNSPTRDLSTHYEVPQENGNRMEARWVEVLDEAGRGLRAVRRDGCGLFSWSASHHATGAIDAARHPCDLVEEDALLLRLDVATAGVGSGACGPGIGSDVQVRTKATEFSFKLAKIVEV